MTPANPRSRASEQAKTKKLAQKAKELSKEGKQAQARGKVLNQAANRFKEVEQVQAKWRPRGDLHLGKQSDLSCGGLYPAIDPLSYSSVHLELDVIRQRHFEIAEEIL